MIKEAIQYIVGLGTVETFTIEDQDFSSQKLHLIEQPVANSLLVHSLSGLIDYLKSNFDSEETVMIHVQSPTEVSVYHSLNGNRKRECLIRAIPQLPQFRFDEWYDQESFIIKLQSAFVQNDDRDVVLKVVGNVKEEDVRTYGDDGISQSVTAKAGIATISQVVVPNPVTLAPFRTFVEIKQPESDFVFRMKNGPRCAFFEADGGAWKLEAMREIKTYLQLLLSEEVESGKIVIIA